MAHSANRTAFQLEQQRHVNCTYFYTTLQHDTLQSTQLHQSESRRYQHKSQQHKSLTTQQPAISYLANGGLLVLAGNCHNVLPATAVTYFPATAVTYFPATAARWLNRHVLLGALYDDIGRIQNELGNLFAQGGAKVEELRGRLDAAAQELGHLVPPGTKRPTMMLAPPPDAMAGMGVLCPELHSNSMYTTGNGGQDVYQRVMEEAFPPLPNSASRPVVDKGKQAMSQRPGAVASHPQFAGVLPPSQPADMAYPQVPDTPQHKVQKGKQPMPEQSRAVPAQTQSNDVRGKLPSQPKEEDVAHSSAVPRTSGQHEVDNTGEQQPVYAEDQVATADFFDGPQSPPARHVPLLSRQCHGGGCHPGYLLDRPMRHHCYRKCNAVYRRATSLCCGPKKSPARRPPLMMPQQGPRRLNQISGL
ncbi:hypothetical protein LTR85_004881 [Meristemomyces frigidus]|nr:hypothetical protein LTR85_004881 [Meristemomyces frigidus]